MTNVFETASVQVLAIFAMAKEGPLLNIVKFVHLAAFSGAFGTSVWVTFLGGIIMFKNLPRHQFGIVQSKLFPAYFYLVATSAALCLAAMALLHPWATASYDECVQFFALGSTLTFTLINLLILEPWTTKVMKERHKVERDEGIGSEIGLSKNREVAKKNQTLQKLNRKFGKFHGMSSLANMVSLCGILVHLWYLSQHIGV